MKEIGISEFKAKCIDKLKTVQESGEPLLVTLRKRPIAVINPYIDNASSKRETGHNAWLDYHPWRYCAL